MKKVIFLDIDGVLQPDSWRKRFEVDRESLRKDIAEKYQDEEYLRFDVYDLAAVYCDWRNESVNLLRKLMEETEALLVLESNWRCHYSLENIRRLFRIHDLFICDRVNPELGKGLAIREYLDSHKEIEKYVIIDDYIHPFKDLFEEVVLICPRNAFIEENFEQAMRVLR